MEAKQVAGFLQQRLAAAKAIPPERRTPDVSAFIETCRLQQEVADALDLPAGLTTRIDGQWTCALALKFARALYVDDGRQALPWSPRLHEYAHDQIIALSMLGKLFHASTSLDTAAKATAALISTVEGKSREEILGTLTTANQAVAQLQQPAMRRRLKRELAAVQQQEGWQLLSYKQLLTLFVSYAASVAETLHNELAVEAARSLLVIPPGTKRAMQAEVLKAFKTTTELLPRLEPDRPRFLVQAAEALNGVALFTSDRSCPPNERRRELLEKALQLAEQQRSDLYVAYCCYSLVTTAVFDDTTRQAIRPSAALDWLRRAEVAHRRCKGVLPTAWTLALDTRREEVVPAVTALQQLQQQGDRWHPRSLAEMQRSVQCYIVAEGYQAAGSNPYTCTGCDRVAVQLRACSACKEAKYCSVDCQKAHWPAHKHRCRELAKAGAPSSTSAGR